MKSKKSFLLMITGLLLMGFVPGHIQKNYKSAKSKISSLLKSKYQVAITGSGGSQPDDIRGLMLCVDCKEYYTIEQARNLYIHIIDDILEELKKIREIRPYLYSYPIDESFVDLELTFGNASYHPEKKDLVHFVFKSRKGLLVYTTLGRENMKHTTVHKELYQDALQKVKRTQIDLSN